MGAIAIADRPRARSQPDPDLRARIVGAGLRCVARWGVAKSTVDDIAREADCCRASVYRAFPGGRDAVLGALVHAEVERVERTVAATLDAADGDLEELLVGAVVATVGAVRSSDALAFMLVHEPELVRPAVAFRSFDALLARAADFAQPWFEPHLGPRGARRAVEWLVRLVVSHLFLPDPATDPGDEAAARRLVRCFVLPGLRAAVPSDPVRPTAPVHRTH